MKWVYYNVDNYTRDCARKETPRKAMKTGVNVEVKKEDGKTTAFPGRGEAILKHEWGALRRNEYQVTVLISVSNCCNKRFAASPWLSKPTCGKEFCRALFRPLCVSGFIVSVGSFLMCWKRFRDPECNGANDVPGAAKNGSPAAACAATVCREDLEIQIHVEELLTHRICTTSPCHDSPSLHAEIFTRRRRR